MEEKFKYVVATRCFTYNHAAYIEDTLRGFAMQETSFPVVYIIVDDASTDGEQNVLRKWSEENLLVEGDSKLWQTTPYGQLAVSALKGKPNSLFVILLLSENHYQAGIGAKKFDYISQWRDNVSYEAICEGDDYWIDPIKLQKQVDYMQSHPDCCMCFHNAFWLTICNNGVSAKLFADFNLDQDVGIEIIAYKWVVPTASVLVKREYADTPAWMPKVYCGDYSRTLSYLNVGTVHYINMISSVYRYNVQKGSGTMSSIHSGLDVLNEHYKLLKGFRTGAKTEFYPVLDKRILELQDSIEFHTIISKKQYWKLIVRPGLLFRKIHEKLH